MSKPVTTAEVWLWGSKVGYLYQPEGSKLVQFEYDSNLDDPTHHGIHGVYHNPKGKPKYIVAESKYGLSRLGKPKAGKQMGDPWIKKNLPKAVGKSQAKKIILILLLKRKSKVFRCLKKALQMAKLKKIDFS